LIKGFQVLNDTDSLIAAAQHGDLDAYNRLVLAYQDRVYRTACAILLDEDAAADAAQDAFILVYRHLDYFHGGSFYNWLMRVTTNVCLDALRRIRRHPTFSIEALCEDDTEVECPRWLVDDRPSPEAACLQKELHRAIYQGLAQLPVDLRTVVVMIDINAMDYTETARALGKPLGTIKSRLARARRQMRDRLAPYLETQHFPAPQPSSLAWACAGD